MSRRPRQLMAYFVLSSTILFGILYGAYILGRLALTDVPPLIVALLVAKTLVEIGASLNFFTALFVSVAFLASTEPPTRLRPISECPPLGIIYLCCNDLDCDALASLAGLSYRGKLYLVVHDDSSSAQARRDVDAAVERLREPSRWEILLLRRPRRDGGKAGAVNYVLEQTSGLYRYFLLCDNDSTVLDPLTIEKALPYFQDERVAIVQCRSVAVRSSEYSWINQLLARSIDSFHAFMFICSRFGWLPFIGHNAFVRTEAVGAVGGLTPGYFSDDLDLTIRLNLRGYGIVYAPEIQLGEKHPPSYRSFRKRSYKWAYGCVQILKAHAWRVLTAGELSLAEKLSFFQFAGFYAGQTVLLAYLALTFLIGPLVLRGYPVDVTVGLVAGSVLIISIYLPVVSYFVKERSRPGWLGSVILCGLVYGTTDFSCARGVWDCLRNRERQWTPTNSASLQGNNAGLLSEAMFGIALLGIPLLFFPPLLYLPTSFLFAGKFLFGPALSILYDDRRTKVARSGLSMKPALLALLLFAPILGTYLSFESIQATNGSNSVEIRGKDLYVGGQKFLVKGVHYGPWRPGTGPNKGYSYPSAREVDEDLRLIQELNANTILVFDPPGYVLDLAAKYNLKVLYTFYVDWWTIGSPENAGARDSILARVRELQDKPALLGWVLGNEIPESAIEQRDQGAIVDGLRDLYQAVKSLDSQHPITSANWPPAKDLDLRFFDITSFNLYPLWPPEVVAMGYGAYIIRVLQPIAGDKPLLLTEFGVNSIEAGEDGQARLLRQSWNGIRESGAVGGIIFEFADEWWKNYDNPARPGDWWDRVPAPDDEKKQDQDPEETYGIVTATRQPKPAFSVVKEIFSAETTVDERAIPAAIVGLLIFGAAGAWLWARSRRQSPSPAREELTEATRR
jgi:GT2 family glycosyltransferase